MKSINPLEANFGTLVISIASSALMAMGFAPDPTTNKTEKDIKMARFNIDLILLLKDKTKGNLTTDEEKLLHQIIADLQLKYVEAQKGG